MSKPLVLLPGTTLEDAKKEGVLWTRDWVGEYAECLFLPGYIVRNLGYIPTPEVAWLLNELASRR